jgi:hypothetical protein
MEKIKKVEEEFARGRKVRTSLEKFDNSKLLKSEIIEIKSKKDCKNLKYIISP